VGRDGPGNWARQKPRKWLGWYWPKTVRSISAQHIFFLFLGWAEAKWCGPGPHGCWLDLATMQSNYAACRTRIRSACSNLAAAMERPRYLTPDCLNGGLAGRDEEGLTWGRWLRLWQRWWSLAEEAKEEEENGRGCREERERFTVALGGWLVASCDEADGGKTNDEGGGSWRPRRREKEEKGLVAGKLSRKG